MPCFMSFFVLPIRAVLCLAWCVEAMSQGVDNQGALENLTASGVGGRPGGGVCRSFAQPWEAVWWQ